MMREASKLLKGLVGASGFEPETSCAQGRRATRLRYAPTCGKFILLRFRVRFHSNESCVPSLETETVRSPAK